MQGKLVLQLLTSAQTHIPSLGFTIEAIQAGARATGAASSSAVAGFFPNPQSTASALLKRFDECYWETVSQKGHRSGFRGVEEQSKALKEAVEIVEDKLVASFPVKERLPDALAALVTKTVPSIPIPVPNPSPVLHRAYTIADEALHQAGWVGSLSTDWYAKRLALSNAFLLAELHMISPDRQEETDITPTLQLFQRLAPTASLDGRAPHRDTDFPPLNDWAKWGTQGWLGILRSYGL